MKLVRPSAFLRRAPLFLRKTLSALVAVYALVAPKSAPASYQPEKEISFSNRAQKVKKAMEQVAPFPSSDQSARRPLQMQWGNWPNWQNWGNWGNWNNWNNWPNWRNW